MMDLKIYLSTNTCYFRINKSKKTDYFLKLQFNSKLKPLYTAFLYSTKRSQYRIGIKFKKDPFAIEQNNSLTKSLKFYIVYDYLLSQEILLTISNWRISYLDQLMY